ncbi:D-cysteine desulfhydrase family protein [Clostridium luticellarii]|jgi:D-cysteine desulfhydrase|nr:D-cysteine desulfhydrase family protein [Clostridium luticellarii]MCI1945168.1 D-cysteine desulfhydrase family protein [Clostridium luticellarii]MCI1968556.1 D-cysteine desulfhydrase family protein [Clostridium luticellarii]
MIEIPERIEIANLPTRIEKLERLSDKLGGPSIYIKRDDQTGTEFSGNKIRKLEFSIKEAIDRKCDTIITFGGVQSNHCRATAAVSAKLGLKSYLILRENNDIKLDGNLFLDKLFGANIEFINCENYENEKTEAADKIKEKLKSRGHKVYTIPSGASNGIGSFGYYKAMQEIIFQEKELGIHFDKIVIAAGSGGTYSGLLLGSKIFNYRGEIIGISVSDSREKFKNKVCEILSESVNYINIPLSFSKDEIDVLDNYVGEGYGLSSREELKFINEFAKLEGIILDPVYTGKAMYGLSCEIAKGKFSDCKNILFINTGGIFGIFPQKYLFDFSN